MLAVVPARLAELETIIERGQPTFIEVGLALAEIRDSKLYRAEYKTFDAYCRERWGWTRSYGYRLISAAEMLPIGDKPPPNEYQARLLRQPPEPTHAAYPALLAALQAIEALAFDVDELARSIPIKSQERWIRRLRRAGTFLGHIAYTIEEGVERDS